MKDVNYVLCCSKDNEGFALTFNANEVNVLKIKHSYFSKLGYSFVFYSLKNGVLELSDLNVLNYVLV